MSSHFFRFSSPSGSPVKIHVLGFHKNTAVCATSISYYSLEISSNSSKITYSYWYLLYIFLLFIDALHAIWLCHMTINHMPLNVTFPQHNFQRFTTARQRCIGPHCTGPTPLLTRDFTVQGPHPLPSGHGTSFYGVPLLVTPGGHPLRPVQTCPLEDPLTVLTSGGHWSTNRWQVDGMHPTGMLSCYRPQWSCGKVMFLHQSVILFKGGRVADPPPPSSSCWEIRATSGRYASYWNAHLFYNSIFTL